MEKVRMNNVLDKVAAYPQSPPLKATPSIRRIGNIVALSGPPAVRTCAVIPNCRTLIVAKKNSSRNWRPRRGISITKNLFIREQPSSAAASKTSVPIFCNPVKKTKKGSDAIQGKLINNKEYKAVLGSPNQFCAKESNPTACRAVFNKPRLG